MTTMKYKVLVERVFKLIARRVRCMPDPLDSALSAQYFIVLAPFSFLWHLYDALNLNGQDENNAFASFVLGRLS
jgi:hypothetical protein